MESSGFFNANLVNGEYDRVYLAEMFAKYFAAFIGNGVYGGKGSELVVTANTVPNMGLQVQSGQAYINGYWYGNDAPLMLPLDIADGINPRIDSVVLRWGNVERAIWLTINKGTPASNPVAPPLLRSVDYYDLQLCTVRVNAGAISVNQANVTDTRTNNAVCGFVHGVVQQFDTTAFGIQLQDFIDNYIIQAGMDHNGFIDFLQQQEVDVSQQINDLIAQLEGLFDQDAVAQLTLRISALEAWKPIIENALQTLNTHAARHAVGGEDPVTPISIGAAPISHNHNADDVNAGRLALTRLPTSAVANRILKVPTANGDPIYTQINLATDVVGVLPIANGGSNSPTQVSLRLVLLWSGAMGQTGIIGPPIPEIANYTVLGLRDTSGRIHIVRRDQQPIVLQMITETVNGCTIHLMSFNWQAASNRFEPTSYRGIVLNHGQTVNTPAFPPGGEPNLINAIFGVL